MLSTLAAALVIATSPGAVELRIRVPSDIGFGDPIQVEVEFSNRGTSTVYVPKLWLTTFAFTLVNPETGKTLLEPMTLYSFDAPKGISVALAAGQTRTERANLWPFISGAVHWVNGQGVLATPGLLYPGRYRLNAVAHPVMGIPVGFTMVRATTEFAVREGTRTQELGIVRKALAESEATHSSPEFSALASAVEQLRTCCSESPVLEPMWKAACLTPTGTPETLQCADGFLKKFPSSWWASQVRSFAPQQVERNEAYVEDAAAMKAASSPEAKRYGEAMNSPSTEAIVKLTREFVRDYPRSALAPYLMRKAIFMLHSNGRELEAKKLAEDLVAAYPSSSVVRRWTGNPKLLDAPPGKKDESR